MQLRKTLLFLWILFLPINNELIITKNKQEFTNNYLSSEEMYLNVKINYGNDALHNEEPTMVSIDVSHKNIKNIDSFILEGTGTITSLLNQNNPDPKLELDAQIYYVIEKETTATWNNYFAQYNYYKYDANGDNTKLESNYLHPSYPKMFGKPKIIDDNNFKIEAIAPAEDLWYAPTIEEIAIISNLKESNNLGSITFEDITLKENISPLIWVLIAIIIFGIVSLISWKIYKKKNKYLI